MSRETMSEEERRRRRNEASRRCYLKRKAELAAQAKPVGVKNMKPKTKAAEAKPMRRGPDPIVAAERLCRTYAKVANGVKPMVKDAAEFLGIVYKSEDKRVVEKVERILTKGLGVKVSRLESDPAETTRVRVDAASKAVKTPKFRLTAQEDGAPSVPVPASDEQPSQPEPETEPEPEAEDEPAEVPVDPAFLEKVDAGEADKSEIEIPQDKNDEDDEDEIDSEDDEYEDEDEDEDEDDEDDEDDESEEARERRVRRRRREESDNVREYETGRWDMFGEMGAQGAFDD